MIGAIIGDLAAWTWEHDREVFYKKLILPEAVTSSRLMDMYLTTDLLMRQKDMDRETYSTYFGDRNPIATVIRAIAIGWLYDSEQETRKAFQKYGLDDDKEDWYAGSFMCMLIYALRHGASKKESALVSHISPFQEMFENFQDKDTILGILIRAWKAFESSFDFGSAIHNAMILPRDHHINGIFVGALADAMYGCERYFVKSKYGQGCSLSINKYVPDVILQLCHSKRVFFPKNCAATNVEKHKWSKVPNPYKDKIITPELYRRILKSFQPDFDYRYGVYLDDGLVYVYRSGQVLQRFKLIKQDDGTYRIADLQSAECIGKLDNPIEEALYSVEFQWNLVGDENEFHQGH